MRRRGATWRRRYEQKQRTADAVSALERYRALRPRTRTRSASSPSQYSTLSQTYATDYQTAQNEAQAASPGSAFAPASSTILREDLQRPERPRRTRSGRSISAQAQTKAQTALANYQDAQTHAEGALQEACEADTDAT